MGESCHNGQTGVKARRTCGGSDAAWRRGFGAGGEGVGLNRDEGGERPVCGGPVEGAGGGISVADGMSPLDLI